MSEIELSVKGYKCERCNHRWQPHKKTRPMVCPKCHSCYWDKPKKIESEENDNTNN